MTKNKQTNSTASFKAFTVRKKSLQTYEEIILPIKGYKYFTADKNRNKVIDSCVSSLDSQNQN